MKKLTMVITVSAITAACLCGCSSDSTGNNLGRTLERETDNMMYDTNDGYYNDVYDGRYYTDENGAGYYGTGYGTGGYYGNNDSAY